MALQLRRKTHESVIYIDRDSAPRIIPSGEDFILEDLPIGTRVLYPNPSIKGLPNREAAIRYALNHPHGCDPLFAQLEPGMRVTIAVDDISLPLPPMATPDIRQTILEIVCDMLAPGAPLSGRAPLSHVAGTIEWTEFSFALFSRLLNEVT